MKLAWKGIELLVQSARAGDDLLLLVTPLAVPRCAPLLVVEGGLLWNRPGYVVRDGDTLVGHFPGGGAVQAHVTGQVVEEPYITAQGPYLAMALQGPLGVSSGRAYRLEEIQRLVAAAQAAREKYVA